MSISTRSVGGRSSSALTTRFLNRLASSRRTTTHPPLQPSTPAMDGPGVGSVWPGNGAAMTIPGVTLKRRQQCRKASRRVSLRVATYYVHCAVNIVIILICATSVIFTVQKISRIMMLNAEVTEGQLLDEFLEALRGLPEVQAELGPPLQSGGPDRGYDARIDLGSAGWLPP